MKKWIFALFLIVASNGLFADGMVFKGRDFSSYIPVTEESQHAIIAHKDGREAMLLAVNFNLEDNEKAFWLFPVPGKPEEVTADIVDTFPKIRGIDPRVTARMTFGMLFGMQIMSQPYTWPFMCCMSSLGKAGMDLDVYSVVEKNGLRVETLSAKTITSLAEYLNGKDNKIEESELKAFTDYLSEEYSFVFVEIYSKEELVKEFPDYENFQRGEKDKWPAVFVEFPSEKIFFPLKPTSAYKEPIQIIVKVLGYVQNEAELSEGWHHDYYRQIKTEETFADLFKPYITEEPFCYTTYHYYGEAGELTDDLWMVPCEPKGIRYAKFVDVLGELGNGYVILILGITIFLMQSWTCAGLTGLIFFRKWHPYAVLGLGNIVTLFGVYLLVKYSKAFPEAEFSRSEEKMRSFRLYRSGTELTKGTCFLLLFSVLFMITSIVLYVLFTLPFYGT